MTRYQKSIRDFLSGLLQQIVASWFVSSALGKAVISVIGAFLLALWTKAYAVPPPILVVLGLFVFVVILHGLTLLTRREESAAPPPTYQRRQRHTVCNGPE